VKKILSTISSLQEEMYRLQLQSEELSDYALESIKKANISKGMIVADIGCGTADVSFKIAKLVEPKGKVIGLDANPAAVKYGTTMASVHNIKNVEFIFGDAEKIKLGNKSVDVSYSRFLLSHVKNPQAVLQEMIRITRPEGTVMIEDTDLSCWCVEPENKYVNQLWTWYESIIRKSGSDPTIGRKLYSMFVAKDLTPKINVYSIPFLYHNRKMWESIIDLLRKVKDGKSDRFGQLVKGLGQFAKEKDSLFIFPLIFRVWAHV
jgi:ubiquinone/menaquinone biosynthesis C-methylase UbiE